MKYLEYLNSPHYLAAFCGLLSGLLSFAESKFTKKKYELKYYIKIIVIVFLNVFIVSWLILNNYINLNHSNSNQIGGTSSSTSLNNLQTSVINTSNYSNVDIGNPDF